MNNEHLPVGWIEKPLGKLVTFQKGKKTETSDTWQTGYLRYLGASGLQGLEDGYAATSGAVLAGAKDLLMLWDGERSGLVGCGQVGVVASTVAKMAPNDDILPEYLYYFLDLHFAWIQARRTGTGVPHVPKDLGRILSVRYPSDKDRQKKVVDILQSIDMIIHNTQKQINKLSVTKQGMMADLFSRGIDPASGKLRPSVHDAPELYIDSILGPIPCGWNVNRFDLIAEVIDPNPSHRYPDSIKFGGVPIASTENFDGDDEFELSKCKHISEAEFNKQLERCNYQCDDVIFARKGRIGFARKYGMAKKAFSHTLVVMKAKAGIEPSYLLWLVRSEQFLSSIDFEMNSNSGVPTLGIDVIKRIPSPMPSEAEQGLIARVLDQLNELLSKEKKTLRQLHLKKAGLMRDLLTGKVPVSV
ncbi:hypothetical protein BJP24_19535 [Aeromonas allosaccharophila]|uniref:restriction endonuclease subunit S n=1 Tax=Aeromonas allosaccharophila TaxID=656 RepID=UPI0005B1F2C7|nr:restriction endonuclease subunit S [Aeromonas allosaccharophila]OKP42316.1 hypothetical protein BJP24_19535 [Aeromonas allosaccharophila]